LINTSNDIGKGSRYMVDKDINLDNFDLDDDGNVSETDLKLRREIFEIKSREEKAKTQERMAWIAMISMLVVTAVLLLADISDGKLTALNEPIGWFYIAQASIVGAFFGFTTWMGKN